MGTRFKLGPSPWKPITNETDLKHLGKLGEEAGELVTAVSRTIIQGIDGIDPKTNQVNREWLEDEMADVMALVAHNIRHFKLNEARVMERMEAKMKYAEPWLKATSPP